jgi:hypothetical protein
VFRDSSTDRSPLPAPPRRTRSAHARIALSVLAALLSSAALAACGGSSVSDAVPKSTPDITPPTNTSAEKAAIQTTSTTTTPSKTSTAGTGTTGETPSSGEAEKSESKESAPSESSAGTGGGTSAGEKEAAKTESKTESKSESGSSPTGGASAP